MVVGALVVVVGAFVVVVVTCTEIIPFSGCLLLTLIIIELSTDYFNITIKYKNINPCLAVY